MGRAFSAYGTLVMVLPSFKYLGNIMDSTNNDWPVVEHNLQQVWGNWGRMVKILVIEGVDRRTAGVLYVAVVQAEKFFG